MHSLTSTHIWMLSGTPFTKKIDEMQGVLSLLRLWPFALSKGADQKGGWTNWFWVQEIKEKWENKDPRVLQTLLSLLRGVMMRHSRFQCYIEEGPGELGRNVGQMEICDSSSSSSSSSSSNSSSSMVSSPPGFPRALRPLVPLPPLTLQYVGLSIPRGSSEAYVHDILSVWSLELLERIEVIAKQTGSLGKNNYAVMGGMLSRLKLSVNCLALLNLQELDDYHRRLQQRDRNAEFGDEVNLDMDVPQQLPTAMGMEDGINILSAAEAEKHFITSLAVGTGYNRSGMQVLLDLAAGGRNSVTFTTAKAAMTSSSSNLGREEDEEEEEEDKQVVLACPVCLDEGDAVERPVFLPCMHALCRDCALDLLEATGETIGSRNEFLFCPFNCNSAGVGGAGLRRGYNRASLVEVVRAAPLPPPSDNSSGVVTVMDESSDGNLGEGSTSSCTSSSLQLSPTKCLSSWASLEAIQPPMAEQMANSIRPSAECPSLPAMMLAHFRTLMQQQSTNAGATKLSWLKALIDQLLREDITNKILILVENNAIVEGVCSALEASLMSTAAAPSANRSYERQEHEQLAGLAGKSFVRVDSSGNPGYRAQQINLFTDDPAIAVCVATRSIAGVGLNLTVANVVVLFDPAHTPGEENQAVNRVLRLGQTRAVRIYRVYMKHSVEERLLSWRKQKGELDSKVMDSSSFSVQSQDQSSWEEDGLEAGSSGSSSGSSANVAKGRGAGGRGGGGGAAGAVLKEWRVVLGAV